MLRPAHLTTPDCITVEREVKFLLPQYFHFLTWLTCLCTLIKHSFFHLFITIIYVEGVPLNISKQFLKTNCDKVCLDGRDEQNNVFIDKLTTSVVIHCFRIRTVHRPLKTLCKKSFSSTFLQFLSLQRRHNVKFSLQKHQIENKSSTYRFHNSVNLVHCPFSV